ncbi:MAG TPA: hemolysin family protein [Pyrinomonadaceae bacterium]|nr:hemolysin family protein [Pyrinomonadaceae bacterium]
MEIEIGVTALLLLVLVLFATLDMAFGQLSDVGLRRLAAEREERRGEAAGSFLEEILENRARFRFTLSAMMQILLVGVVVLVTSLSLQWFPSTRFILIAFGVGVGLTLTFRQLIPRLLSFRNPEKTFLTLLPLVGPFYRVFSLVAAPWSRSFPSAPQRRGGDEMPAADDDAEEAGGGGDDIQALIDVGEREGIIEEEEGELIHSIIEFGETQAGEVMTPRTDVVALPITATVREARDVILDSKYSRLPVYRDQIDNVEGIIYVRDLLQCWAEGREGEAIEPLLRPAYFVPETKAVDELLEEMRKAHVQMAMVIDEYGGVAGLVTVEDILEEIVGEMEDEDIGSEEIVEIVESGDGYYEVAGSTEVGKIERLFDLEIEDDDFTTIAGLVISESGRVPPAGTRLSFRGLDVEVVEADERRVARLRLRRAPENGDTAGEE